MLDEKQLECARTQTKDFFQQYKLLQVRANARLERIEFWQSYKAGQEYCKELAIEARRLLMLETDIAELLKSVSISELYKKFLFLRYIKCLSMPAVSKELGLTIRYCNKLQTRALEAFAQAV